MPVLYRKYRPQIFAEVIGQEPIVTTLQNQIKSGQLAHAFLFVGSRGIGKTSVARILAKAINCTKSIPHSDSRVFTALNDACGECEVCKAIELGNFIDLVEIDAASNTGVDNIREIIEHTKFSPAKAKYKVFIIDEVHMLSKGAFNALLKTLEEPPAHTVFILATTEVGKIPPTIISRTQRFDFKRLAPSLIESYLQKVLNLEQVKLNEQVIKLIAVNAEGGMRDALSLLDKVLSLGAQAETKDIFRILGIANISQLEKFAELIFNHHTALIPGFLNELYEAGVDFIAFNKDFLEYLRKVLIVKVFKTSPDWGLTTAQLAVLENLSQSQTEAKLINTVRLFLRSLKEQVSAPSVDLPVLLAGIEASLKANITSGQAKTSSQITPHPLVGVSTPTVTVAPPPSISQRSESVLTLEQIADQWSVFVNQVKQVNGPLANVLRTAEVVRIKNQKIFVLVKYQFHKQNLEQAKNSSLIGERLTEVYRQPLELVAEVKEAQEVGESTVNDLSSALKVFGGELVE